MLLPSPFVKGAQGGFFNNHLNFLRSYLLSVPLIISSMFAKRSSTRCKNIHEEEAQGMVEFAIVFPVLFFFFLAICQTALLYTAREVVQYASFAAVRSAVVWIPETVDIDGTTPIGAEFQIDDPAKLNKPEMAAALACISIAPEVSFTGYATFVAGFAQLYVDILSTLGAASSKDYFSMAGITDPGNPLFKPEIFSHSYDQIQKLGNANDLKNNVKIALVLAALGKLSYSELNGQGLGKKYVYSRFFTAVNFYEPGTDTEFPDNYHYEAGEDISAEVTHFYSMKVPVINKLIFMAYMTLYLPNELADNMEAGGYSQSSISSTLKELEEKMDEVMGRHNLSFYPIPIRARSTLSVEGDLDWS